MGTTNERQPGQTAGAAARRAVFGLGVREFGIAAIATVVLLSVGLWSRRQSRATTAEQAVIRRELAMAADAAEVYRDRYRALQDATARTRAWADAQTDEPLRTWARERARRAEALLNAVNREADARAFAAGRAAIEQALARGDVAGARARLARVPAPQFPIPAEFGRLKAQLFDEPLAAFSRQNPDYYRALRRWEPDASRRDEQALRGELAAAGADNVTPQLILKADLLAAVAAKDDPVVAEWTALASAVDYFETPDEATLGRWRKAQHASRTGDWATAAAEMQAILKSRVRTRQPFRAALGRALLKCRPDAPAEAYPFLAEAAAAGDKQARSWVAREDLRQKRYAQAQRWLEAAVADGDTDAVPSLIEAYDAQPDPAEIPRRAAVLERVSDRPEVPAAALLELGRLYERIDPPGSSRRAAALFVRAAAKGSAAAAAEVARAAFIGAGMPVNPDQARDAAAQAYAGGERESAAAVLLELMARSPGTTAPTVLRLVEQESVNGGGGYMESRIVDGPGVARLKAAVARYYDQAGLLGQAARVYAASRDSAAVHRHAELTVSHPCETCGGAGKVQGTATCPSCGGKGRQTCSFCSGSGFINVPGSPPCGTCGGSGTIVQDRKLVTCGACGGTGKGKGSVVKQDCTHCEHGYVRCPDCVGGKISVLKECPDCHGRGAWTLIDRGAE